MFLFDRLQDITLYWTPQINHDVLKKTTHTRTILLVTHLPEAILTAHTAQTVITRPLNECHVHQVDQVVPVIQPHRKVLDDQEMDQEDIMLVTVQQQVAVFHMALHIVIIHTTFKPTTLSNILQNFMYLFLHYFMMLI